MPTASRRATFAEPFHVVALGGSAGSLDALERFFRHLPPASGLAFVVVVHQLPGQDGELAQLLQRFTNLRVLPAAEGLRPRPDHVYVADPDHELSLVGGQLYLPPPTVPPARRMPIDYFLESLALDAGDRAVAIILSGAGSDGSVGLKLVMENFGMVIVQDSATAAFDAMPRAALATGFVDFELSPEHMPAQLLDYAARPLLRRLPRELEEGPSVQPAHALQRIFALIRAQMGHDFSLYKRNTMFRRIERRMNAHQIKGFPAYARYLQENPHEVGQLFRELLIGVTKFFRDAEAFERLKQHLRPLVQAKPAESTVRVWAPGCSTGEEAYSLAITILELFEELEPGRYLKLQLFATDLSADSIDFARAAVYPDNITADVSAERLERYFVRHENSGYQIRKEVRDAVVFALHNINKDAPFTKLDLLCCRNLLIYLSSELQKNLLPVFHYALNPGGLLFLGPSENISAFHDLFQPLDVKWKISRRTNVHLPLLQLAQFPFALGQGLPPTLSPTSLMSTSLPTRRDGGTFAHLVQRELVRSYAPPAVIINHKGEILYVNGRTGRYLEPAPGLSGMNLFEMAREKLNVEISGAVHRAIQSRDDVVVDNVPVETNAGPQLLRLSVRYLLDPEPLANLLLVSFEDQPTPRATRRGKRPPATAEQEATIAALSKELQFTKHRLQTTIEEMETSLEELKSTNEELQSANEELQSSNEEAMTNKEEMQSLNEELMTLNMQYQAKSEELGQTASDMKNLLDATEIAIIFLDNDMIIKRFTPPVARIINLVASDVGRPLTHFASNLRYENLARDVRQVLDRLTSLEVNIQKTTGEWYTMRILPYRTLDNYISGAIITFTENTSFKRLEGQLQEKMGFMESMQAAVAQPVLVFDEHLRVSFSNQAFADLLGAAPEWLRAQSLPTLGPSWSQPALRDQLEQLVQPDSGAPDFDHLALDVELGGRGRHRLHLYARRLRHQDQPTGQVLLGVQSVEAPHPPAPSPSERGSRTITDAS